MLFVLVRIRPLGALFGCREVVWLVSALQRVCSLSLLDFQSLEAAVLFVVVVLIRFDRGVEYLCISVCPQLVLCSE